MIETSMSICPSQSSTAGSILKSSSSIARIPVGVSALISWTRALLPYTGPELPIMEDNIRELTPGFADIRYGALHIPLEPLIFFG